MSKLDHPTWFFCWSKGTPYVTNISSWTKDDMIQEAEKEFGMTWKQIYKRGGRAVRVKMTIVKGEAKKKGH